MQLISIFSNLKAKVEGTTYFDTIKKMKNKEFIFLYWFIVIIYSLAVEIEILFVKGTYIYVYKRNNYKRFL